MEQVAKHKGIDESVNIELPPDAFEYVWSWFWELHSKRQSGMGENAISSSDIMAWQSLSGNIIRPCEFKWITAMDRAYLGFKAEDHKKKQKKNKAKAK